MQLLQIVQILSFLLKNPKTIIIPQPRKQQQKQTAINYPQQKNKKQLSLTQSSRMNSQSLFKIQDVNTVIKLFAYSIQQRFEQIDGIVKNSNQDYDGHGHGYGKYGSTQGIQDSEYLVRKYRAYVATEDKEVRYLEKLVVRIMQILEFFKQRAKNQQVLTVAIKKIQERLNKIVKSPSIDVQCLYSYILDLAKYGFSIKKTPFKDRRHSLKKIQPSDHKITDQNTDIKKVEESNQLKSISNTNVNSNTCTTNTLTGTITISNPTKYRRPVSLSAKKIVKSFIVKQPLQAQMSKIYSILDIDYCQIQKLIENKEKEKREEKDKEKIRVEKDMIKQNYTILNAILNYDKGFSAFMKRKQKQKQKEKEKEKNDNPLKQVNNRSLVRPIVNNWISRKRKIAECKKKLIDCQNYC